jgi:hypothetical protein
MHTPHVKSGGRYPVLRALAIMYVLGAALAAIGAIIYAAYAVVRYNLAWNDRLTIVGATLVGGFITVITMLAVAELLKLFIDVEHNTRMAIPSQMGMSTAAPSDVARAEGAAMPHVNRLDGIDEETAEGALLRGH